MLAEGLKSECFWAVSDMCEAVGWLGLGTDLNDSLGGMALPAQETFLQAWLKTVLWIALKSRVD